MSNSKLVTHTRISPNKSNGRSGAKIDMITIHCVVGQCTVESLGDIFAPSSRGASSNYGVGSDGRIGMYVEEKDRSWCTSSASNDNRAITIEVASDTTHPYAVNDKAMEGLIELCADICKRNGISKLLWQGDKGLVGNTSKQNMSVHRWFANKACPGDYLYERHGYIADEVNKLLGASSIVSPSVPAPPVGEKKYYKVQVGAFGEERNAENYLKELSNKGYECFIIYVDKLYKVQMGAFEQKGNADALAAKLKQQGMDAFIKYE